MNRVIVFDADNTIWDTNEVFLSAQLDLLRVYEKVGLIRSAESELETLRRIDSSLISRLERFEYDFVTLALALAEYFSEGLTVDRAVDRALRANLSSETPPLVLQAHDAFISGLRRMPRLDENMPDVLHTIRQAGSKASQIVLFLFSDGDSERLRRILQFHRLDRNVFDEIVITKKSVDSFITLKRTAVNYLSQTSGNSTPSFVMVGDSLKRDIIFAKQAGFITVYKPAGFFGEESSADLKQEPDFRITSLAELPGLVSDLLTVERTRRQRRRAVSG